MRTITESFESLPLCVLQTRIGLKQRTIFILPLMISIKCKTELGER